ncbi:hypothetical protein IFR05_007042 [Cadophora sp. M221]|nr:hypothetical protein IFR05_007042 [Cadophora sp. M221]
MSSGPSSTCATNGSANSSTAHPEPNTEAATDSLPPSPPPQAPSTSDTAARESSNVTTGPIAAYTTNPVDPNPSYTNTSTEASVAAHRATVKSVIDNFDTVMVKAGQDKDGESSEK